MADDRAKAATHPAHDWGAMAKDPFMMLSRDDAETRSILKRMWTRSGGDPDFFDTLIPETVGVDSPLDTGAR